MVRLTPARLAPRFALVLVLGLVLSLAAPAGSSGFLGALECDEVEHRPLREEFDFRLQRQILETSGCIRDGHAVAFLHRYELAPEIQPLVDLDDPQGSGLTVAGDGWRLDLTAELAGDLELARQLAAAGDGEVTRRLLPAFCLLEHPNPPDR